MVDKSIRQPISLSLSLGSFKELSEPSLYQILLLTYCISFGYVIFKSAFFTLSLQHIGLLFRFTRKAIKRECREIRQQSRCCKLLAVLNNSVATVCLQANGKAFIKRSKSEDLPCNSCFNAFEDRATNQYCIGLLC